MAVEKIIKSWKSGSVRGYNGDGIRITATYQIEPPEVSPRVVDFRFYDNATRKNGPIARMRSFPVEGAGWSDIPWPDPDGSFGEGVNEGYSIKGQIRLEPRGGIAHLRVRFHWGEDQVHTEEGFVMALDDQGD